MRDLADPAKSQGDLAVYLSLLGLFVKRGSRYPPRFRGLLRLQRVARYGSEYTAGRSDWQGRARSDGGVSQRLAKQAPPV